MALFRNPPVTHELEDAMCFLSRWHFSASADGCLWIEAQAGEVKLSDFCVLVKRVRRAVQPGRYRAIVFHFDNVLVPVSLWPVFVDMVAGLARTMQGTFKLILQDRPASREGGGDAPRTNAASLRRIRLEGTCIAIERCGCRQDTAAA